MSVSLLDLTGKDGAGIVAAIQNVVDDAGSRNETVTAMSAVLDGSAVVVVTAPAAMSGPAQELEDFKRLLDAGAIGLIDFNTVKNRLISSR